MACLPLGSSLGALKTNAVGSFDGVFLSTVAKTNEFFRHPSYLLSCSNIFPVDGSSTTLILAKGDTCDFSNSC